MDAALRGWSLARQAKSLVRRPYLPLYRLEGLYEGTPLRLLVADDGLTLAYVNGFVFSGEARPRREGLIPSVMAPRLAEADADIVVVGANRLLLPLYRDRAFYIAPKFVRLLMPVWDHPDVIIDSLGQPSRRDLRENVHKMRNRGFGFDITMDPSWFDRFYDEMYLPYASNRFGDQAIVYGRRRLKRAFERGCLLIVTQHGEPVAAALKIVVDSVLHNVCRGVLNGDVEIARRGAAIALYYYSILFALSRGCAFADFGNSRPFLTDGALSHKLKWGMKVFSDDSGVGVFAIASPGRTEQAVKFLSGNPFYHYTENGVEPCGAF